MTTAPASICLELDVAIPGASYSNPETHGVRPHGVAYGLLPGLPVSETLNASDAGYVTLSTDAGGVVAYPPLLAQGLAIQRGMNLVPGAAAAAAGWGTLSLMNLGGRFNAYSLSRNSDGRPLRLYRARMIYDSARGYYTSPAKASRTLLFAGLSGPWALSEATLDIPARDGSYWLERPLQSTLYAGTGLLEGGADLTGKPKPKARGGTNSYPILNVPAVLVDATHLIYQYSDAPGTVVQVYEGGNAGFTAGADVADLYTGSTTAGTYRTNNARGLFQLGSTPTRTITADVTGQFASAGAQTSLLNIARYLLAEDCALPSANLDTSSFTSLAATYPYTAGVWFDTNPVQCVDAVNTVLSAAGLQLLPLRSGVLSVMALRAPSASYTARLDTTNIVTLKARALPPQLYPPAFRAGAGYQRSYLVQTSDISPSITAARKTLVATQDRTAMWVDTNVASNWKRPNDLLPVGGALQVLADAQAVANAYGALWGVTRRLYDITVPLDTAAALDLGQVVQVVYPAADLTNGKPGLIVGETLNTFDATSILQVLV